MIKIKNYILEHFKGGVKMYEVILLMIIGVILSGISIVLGKVIFERKF